MSSDEFERSQRQNAEQRRAFIERWAEYVRTHDDEEWSRQQNTLTDSQLEAANEMARRGDTDPVAFFEARDRHRTARRVIDTQRRREWREGSLPSSLLTQYDPAVG